MMTQLSGDWSVFKRIFADHWDPFQRAHPRYQTPYYDNLVAKMLENLIRALVIFNGLRSRYC
jgi:hypothetical protein